MSRAKKSIYNSIVSLSFYVLGAAIAFISRAYVLTYLGDQIPGMQSTIANMLSMVGLLELGVGAAIAYSLYKPLVENNHEEICRLVSVQAWFYRRVVAIVSIVFFIIVLFFPIIFDELEAPMLYAYTAFAVSYVGYLLGYLVNFRSIVLHADQKGYKLAMSVQGFNLLKNIIQILVLRYVPNPYLYYLGLELVMSLLSSYLLERILRREYPWLKIVKINGSTLAQDYQQVITKTKQLFVHKIAEVSLGYVAPLIMFSYSSLVAMTHYGNYTTLTTHITAIMGSIFAGIAAGMGSLTAEDDMTRTFKFFWEYLATRHFFATIAIFGFYSFAPDFIRLWIGPQYILPNSLLILICIYCFIGLTRDCITSQTNAFGLFGDVWAPIIESIINIGLSIILGMYFGLEGVLFGVIVSLVLVVMGWKPYYLFTRGFKIPVYTYWMNYIKYPVIGILAILLTVKIRISFGISNTVTDWSSLIGTAIYQTSIFSVALFAIYSSISTGFRGTLVRLYTTLIKRS